MAWSRTGHCLNRCRSNSLMLICGIRREGAVNDAVAFTIALQDLFLCGGHHLTVKNVFHKCKSVTDALFLYYCIYSLFTITPNNFKIHFVLPRFKQPGVGDEFMHHWTGPLKQKKNKCLRCTSRGSTRNASHFNAGWRSCCYSERFMLDFVNAIPGGHWLN